MTISIIVPIYKVEKYLVQCVDSILNQSYRDIEIILVDDGSPDNCPQICDEYAEKDSRVKAIHKQNGGLIAARKSGVEIATGEYITFVDGDDWIAPDMYEKVADSIERYHADCVITQFYFAYEDHLVSSRYLLDKEYYLRDELEKNVFPTMLFSGEYYRFSIYPNCWTKVFRRKIIKNNIFSVDNRVRLGEDASFTYACLFDCQSLSFVDMPLYYYRQNPESMTARYDPLLSDIFDIPYYSIKHKCNEIHYPFDEQLSFYFYYLINFYLRNEAGCDYKHSSAVIGKSIDKLFSHEDVLLCCKTVNQNYLPKRSRFVIRMIIKQNKLGLFFYIKLLKLYLRLKG